MLELRNVSKVVGGVTHIRDVSLTLEHGSLNVLLGPTLSGKTSLMRLMAGLDAPTTGSVWFDGKDVTGKPVQQRSVAMVYQQFINYPAMTVYENIASPLRVAGVDKARIDGEVRKAADLLKLTPYLDRTPLNVEQSEMVGMVQESAGALLQILDDLLDFAKRTRALDALLRDASQSTIVLASLDEPLVRAETARLASAIRERGIDVGGIVWNRAAASPQPLPATGAARQFVADETRPPPVGERALRDWSLHWRHALPKP